MAENLNPSIAEMWGMMRGEAPAPVIAPNEPEPAKDDKPATQPEAKKADEPAKVDGEPAPDQGAGDKQQDKSEELPKWAKKRTEAEKAKADAIQAQIDKVYGERKAKERELAEMRAKAEPQDPGEQSPQGKPRAPKRPDWDSFEGTFGEWQELQAKYNKARDEYDARQERWLREEAKREYREAEAQRQAQQDWKAAEKQFGGDFGKLVSRVHQSAPEELQIAISAMPDWAAISHHLGGDPEALAALVETHQQNPYRAIAELGRISDHLKTSVASPDATEKKKPLPASIKPVGGGSGVAAFDADKAAYADLKGEYRKLGVL